MERFNYPTLEAAEAEDLRIIYFLECESWGKRKDEEEELEEEKEKAELEKMRANG